METMRYQENKKSYKGVIIGFFTFVIIGGGIVALGISQEKQPQVIGNNNNVTSNVETQSLVDVDNNNTINISEIVYEVSDKVTNDTENSKLVGNITIPQVSINGEDLVDINTDIDKEYTNRFNSLKEQMKSAKNKFTYKVTYNKYENMVEGKKILSLTIYQRVIDNSSKETTTDKVETYNIDLGTKKIVEESTILLELLGKEYKTKVNEAIKNYVVSKGYVNESEFTYTLTGFENYYIKDSKIHILFNEEEIVDKKYGVLDIVID